MAVPEERFPAFIRALPMVDSPLRSLRGWMLRNDQALTMFYRRLRGRGSLQRAPGRVSGASPGRSPDAQASSPASTSRVLPVISSERTRVSDGKRTRTAGPLRPEERKPRGSVLGH